MKKLLVLAVVLGISATTFGVSASLQSDKSAYNPGETAVISIVADFTASGFGFRLLEDDASITGKVAVGTIYSGYNMGLNDGTGYVVNSGNVLFQRTGGDAVSGSAFTMMGGTNAPAGTALYTFDYTIDSGITAPCTINLSFGNDVYVVNSADAASIAATGVALDVVPEPATLALLGIGGLLLRRRRS